MNRTELPSFRHDRCGFVLLAILVFIFLLSMVTLSLLFHSQGDESAGNALSGSEQAWSAAMSGVQEAMRVAAGITAGSTDWQDDPATFRGRGVYEDGDEHWYFTVYSAAGNDSLADLRYGLSDEASRINLNHPGEADLAKIPGLTPSLAGVLRQFLGQPASAPSASVETAATSESSAEPAVDDSVSPALSMPTTLATPTIVGQVSPHGPLSTLDELLLMPGFNRAMLHGVLIAPESPVAPAPPIKGDKPQLPDEPPKAKRTHGFDQYFTVYSKEPNRSAAGLPRCNINDTNEPLPAVDLPAEFSNYVAIVRGGPPLTHPGEALEATAKGKDAQGAEVEVGSGITKENLATVLDLFAADKDTMHEGLINANTASAAVLATLPGIDLTLAEAIVSARTGLSPERRGSLAWLYQEGVMDAARFRSIVRNLTVRSCQYRFNVIGYGLPSGRYRVLEAVIDTTESAPRLLYLRDVTRLGLPLDLKETTPNKTDGAVQASLRQPGHHPHG